jgi:hypothetical protein
MKSQHKIGYVVKHADGSFHVMTEEGWVACDDHKDLQEVRDKIKPYTEEASE